MYRLRHLVCALCCGLAAHAHAMALITLDVSAQPGVPDLVCHVKAQKPPPAPSPAPADDPLVLPDMEQVEAVLRDVAADAPAAAPPDGLPRTGFFRSVLGERPVLRIGLWGDSHMAAGFFSQELIRLSGLGADQVQGTLIPPTMNRAGVRLPVRKTCVSEGWVYDAAYRSREAAEASGPAMVSLLGQQAGAQLQWDLRNAQGLPVHKRLRLLYHQTVQPIVIGVAVDQGEEQIISLGAEPGAAALELRADGPVSTLALRLISGSLRLHGLGLEAAAGVRLQFDVFALPGATARSWQQADLRYLAQWFQGDPYQLVALAFGTNEGNQKPFDAALYEEGLAQAVRKLRAVFPQAQCLLIGPGDRGVLVRRSSLRAAQKKRAARGKKSPAAVRVAPPPRRAADRALLQYSAIHQQISDIQARIARQSGCSSWSMLQAMGGPASSYAWAAHKPPLMAGDLIHFTPDGYRRLAYIFAKDFGWDEEFLRLGDAQ